MVMLGDFVPAVVVVVSFRLIKGLLSLPNICSLFLFPNSLVQGIFPRIILGAVVLVMNVVELIVSLCLFEN